MAKQTAPLRITRRKAARSRFALSWKELRRLGREVLAHLKRAGVPNLVNVGVGLKNPLNESSKDLSLLFVVSKRVSESKLTARQRLGKKRRYEVRIGAGKKARWVNVGGDVVLARRLRASPVAMEVALGVNSGAIGIILRWTEGGKRRWGLLTAGHVVLQKTPAPLGLWTADGTRIPSAAIRYRPPSSDSRFDAAVLSVSRRDVMKLNDSIDPDHAVALAPSEGINFDGTNDDGRCCTLSAGDVSIDIKAAFAAGVSVDGWRNVKSLLGFMATNPGGQPFAIGNSGSAVIDRSGGPLGVLIASISPQFNMGFAQPLSEVLSHLESEMGIGDLEVIGFC